MNERVLSRIKRKKSAFELYKQTRDGKDYLEYTKTRNSARAEVRKAVREYEKEIAKKAKKNPKMFYKHVNSKLKTRVTGSVLQNANGDKINDNQQKAELFNEFFSSVYTIEDTQNIPESPKMITEHQLNSIHIEETEVAALLKKLHTDKSPGNDGIHPRVLKECADQIALPLTTLFRNSMKEGQLPNEWKEASVTPIFKSGSRVKVENYRPISLTSICCKTLEKLVRKDLLQHMLDNRFMSDNQHGFVSGRSCTTQLLKVVDKLTEILDRGGTLDMIYLDFAKAFDTVPHQRLIQKLKGYGVGVEVLDWIGHFLVGRKQRVGVAGSYSEWSSVLSGVPQGSVLGPLLFVCYINDMPDTVTSFIYMYADDTKMFRQINDQSDTVALQNDLDKLVKWADEWQLHFNVNKCKVMHIGKSKETSCMTMSADSERSHLSETQLEKDLGIWFSSDLKPSVHVSKAVSKANQILGLIRRTFTYIDIPLMKQLFISLVRPHLEYGNVIWHPTLRKDKDMIEAVQRRATKMIPGLAKLSYEERLRRMDLPSLEYRRIRGDAIETFKYLHGKYSVDTATLLLRHEPKGMTTRGHSLKLQKRECHSNIRQNFFSFRVVNMWNSLPEEIVMADSVNCFKGRFDRWNIGIKYQL
jgi:ribosomal protein S20